MYTLKMFEYTNRCQCCLALLFVNIIASLTFAADTMEGDLAQRDIKVKHRYLWLPIQPGGEKRWVSLKVDGTIVRQFKAELASGQSTQWVFTDVAAFLGKNMTIECTPAPDSAALEGIRQQDERPYRDTVYQENLRPQYHFTTQIGRLNDPNGLVYLDGEYHLFYQHNPYGVASENKGWGHAVSSDLLHWREMEMALHPDENGFIYSGSAVIDEHNTAGFAKDSNAKPLVAIYTSYGSKRGTQHEFPWADGKLVTQSIAWSLDQGRTFTKFSGNPILKQSRSGNRDPKVFWHDATKRWVMVLHLDTKKGLFGIFSSSDLKEWQQESDVAFPNVAECPDLFELSVDGNDADKRWVFWAAQGRYLLGQFDGKKFHQMGDPLDTRFGASEYAGQTFSNMPDKRTVQIAWIRSRKYPGMSFDQQMTIPRELTLRTTEDGVRLFIEPVREVTSLRGTEETRKDLNLSSVTPLTWIIDRSFDLEAEIDLGSARQIGLNLFGGIIEYDVEKKQLTVLGKSAPLELNKNRIKLRILVDRISFEVFVNEGRLQMAECLPPKSVLEDADCSIYAEGGEAKIISLKTWPINSVWKTARRSGVAKQDQEDR